ncbi:hypothetical protein RHMOL_Rhmol11G0066600 [Rhododendron molle]|uniref:Uncharacterized protein n=1 Tax=Rhododendron molle TaxID=49168 RepID=A0ACC0LQB6_RHOML|nr:hypothetical protein RHMOL_Rhmol11G0066600 [Rhododendron molle]
MELKRKRKIYELSSLPPFLVVLDGYVEPVEPARFRWGQPEGELPIAAPLSGKSVTLVR